MLNIFKANRMLEDAIEDALLQLKGLDSDSKEYTDRMEMVVKLYALKEKNTPKRVSPDTIALIVGSLIQILLILNYEHKDVLTSKAIGFVKKPF